MFYFYYYTYWCSKKEKIFSFFCCFGTWKGKAGVEPRSVLPFSQYFFWYKIVYNYCLHSFPLLMFPYFPPCLISQSCRIQKIDWTVWVLWRFHIWRIKKKMHCIPCTVECQITFFFKVNIKIPIIERKPSLLFLIIMLVNGQISRFKAW